MKRSSIALSLVLIALGACKQEKTEENPAVKNQLQELSDRIDCITTVNVHKVCAGKIAPHYETNSFFVTADFLYWKASEDNLEFVTHHKLIESQPDISPETLNSLGTQTSNKYENPHFNWDPGFRVGIGVELDHDNWDIFLNYTHIRNTAHRNISTPSFSFLNPILPSDYLVPPLGVTATSYITNQASAKWHVDYNVVDLELGKDFFVGTAQSIRPYVGLKYASISQKYKTIYAFSVFPGVPSSQIHDIFKFKGGGIEGGSDMFWHFSKSWGISAELSGALLYGKFDVKKNIESAAAVTPNPLDPHPMLGNQFTADAWKVRGTLSAAIGLEWEMLFNCDKNRFALNAGYEITEWFQQNQSLEVNPIELPVNPGLGIVFVDFTINHANGNLGFQGLTLKATLDF